MVPNYLGGHTLWGPGTLREQIYVILCIYTFYKFMFTLRMALGSKWLLTKRAYCIYFIHLHTSILKCNWEWKNGFRTNHTWFSTARLRQIHTREASFFPCVGPQSLVMLAWDSCLSCVFRSCPYVYHRSHVLIREGAKNNLHCSPLWCPTGSDGAADHAADRAFGRLKGDPLWPRLSRGGAPDLYDMGLWVVRCLGGMF